MALHFACSDRGEGSGEKRYNQVVSAVKLVAVCDKVVLCGRQAEIHYFAADQCVRVFLRDCKGKGVGNK